jgi:hypothetical protein
MKTLIVSSFFALVSLTAFAGVSSEVSLPSCKDAKGRVLPDSIDQLKVVMKSNANRPQVMITGVVVKILPEDRDGLPHQKYALAVNEQITLLIVSNLDFGRVPLQVGESVSVCGEFKKVGQGMVHWTHFDPHGGHADGFTVANGKLYGDVETPEFN